MKMIDRGFSIELNGVERKALIGYVNYKVRYAAAQFDDDDAVEEWINDKRFGYGQNILKIKHKNAEKDKKTGINRKSKPVIMFVRRYQNCERY